MGKASANSAFLDLEVLDIAHQDMPLPKAGFWGF